MCFQHRFETFQRQFRNSNVLVQWVSNDRSRDTETPRPEATGLGSRNSQVASCSRPQMSSDTCSSADYCEFIFQVGHIIHGISCQYSATVRYVVAYQATYLSHPQPVIDHVGTNLYSLVNWELLGVSSLSKAISQKPSRRALINLEH